MEENLKKIESYLAQEMSPEEKIAFETECENNSELRGELELEVAMREEILHAGREKLRSILDDEYEKILAEENKKKPARMIWYYGFAAAATILILFLLWISFGPETQEPLFTEEFFAQYYQTPKIVDNFMGEANQDTKEEAIAKYEEGDFERAEELFLELMKENPQNDTLNFYVSIIELEKGNVSSAIERLSSFDFKSPRIQDQSEFYLGFAYLKMGEREKAIQIFEKIAKEEHHYFNDDEFRKMLMRIK